MRMDFNLIAAGGAARQDVAVLESELAQLRRETGGAFPESAGAAGRVCARVVPAVERMRQLVRVAHSGGVGDDDRSIDAGDCVRACLGAGPIEDFARFREPQERAEMQRAAVPFKHGESAGFVLPTKIDAEKSQALVWQ